MKLCLTHIDINNVMCVLPDWAYATHYTVEMNSQVNVKTILGQTWALLLRERALYISSMLVATDSKQLLKRSNLSFLICSNACLAFLALLRAASNSETR